MGLLDVLDDERAFDDLDVAVVRRVQVLVVAGGGTHLGVEDWQSARGIIGY